MNEHGYIRAVHRQLAKITPADFIAWKIHDPYQSGVPDAYYAGESGVLWVEYKWLPAIPKRATTAVDLCNPDRFLTLLQQDWLSKLHRKNIRIAVILGTPNGGVIREGMAWTTPLYREDFENECQAHKLVAAYITGCCEPATEDSQGQDRPQCRPTAGVRR